MPSTVMHYSSPRHLGQLYCNRPQNLEKAEKLFGISLTARENWLRVDGPEEGIEAAVSLFGLLDLSRSQGLLIRNADFEFLLAAIGRGEAEHLRRLYESPRVYSFRGRNVMPRTLSQKRYTDLLEEKDIVFGIGPAGTGKTYLAMASALHALLEKRVEKIVITRPAVEAGEALGFLPGDLREKILPYLRPIYDAMHEMVGQEDAARLVEKGMIEIAPLAYMRGRTLSHACVLLDEAQNTTPEQMMMFLTRLGEGSRMIITGDITQVDLPRHRVSGLRQAAKILDGIDGLSFFYFEPGDVIRHPLVQKILERWQLDKDRGGDPSAS